MPKIAVLAPIPSVSIASAASVNPGLLRKARTAYSRSLPEILMFAPGQDKSMRVTNPGRQGFINLGEREARRSVRLWDRRVRFANRSSHFVIERMASMLGSEKLMAFVGTREPQRAKVFYRETLGLELVNEDEFAL